MSLMVRASVLLVTALLTGCGAWRTGTPSSTPSQAETTATSSKTSHGGPVRDHVSFVDNLRSRGVTVEIGRAVQQPFLRPHGTALRLSGGELTQEAVVQSYNYDDTDLGGNAAQAMTEDAARIRPDGSVETAVVEWIAPPHFFRTERLLVLYVGSDATVLKLLTELLGPQFAGA
jgi:hypothetical protein